MSGRIDAVRVDERDTAWERTVADFCVIIVDDAATTAYDIASARYADVLDWAARRAASTASYAVALRIADGDGHPGLIWLIDPPEGI